MRARKARHRRGTVVIAIAIAAVAVLLPALALAPHRARLLLAEPGGRHLGQAGGRRLGPRRPQDLQRPRQEEAGQDPGRLRADAEQEAEEARHRQAALQEQVDQGPEQGPEEGAEEGLQAPRVAAGDQDQEEEGQEAPRLQHQAAAAVRVHLDPGRGHRRPQQRPRRDHAGPLHRAEVARRSRPTTRPAHQYKITNDKNQTGAVSYAYQCPLPERPEPDRRPRPRTRRTSPVPQPPLLDRHDIPDAGPCIRCNLQIQGTGRLARRRHDRRRRRRSPATARRSAPSRTSASAPTAPTASCSTTSRSVTPGSTTST